MSEISTHPIAKPGNAAPTRMIDSFKDRLSKKTTLVATTSKTIAELLASALTTEDCGVTLVTDGTVQYNPIAAADTNSGYLPTVYTIHGGKPFLDLVELYSASETTVSIIVFEAYSA